MFDQNTKFLLEWLVNVPSGLQMLNADAEKRSNKLNFNSSDGSISGNLIFATEL